MPDGLRVVVADDDDMVRSCLRDWLTDLGHEVTTVGGGRALVGACAAAPPDLVVSDVGMPDLDGVSAAAAVRRRDPVPVILLSGAWQPDQLERAAAAGVTRCLDKPITPLQLVTAVEAVRGAAPPRPPAAPAADDRRAAFLVAVAREVRAELAGLPVYTRLLQAPGNPGAVRELAAKIDAVLARVSRLLGEAHDAGRVCRGDVRLARRRVDARAAVERAVAAARPAAGAAGHALTVTVPAAPLWVAADPDRLEQVVANLLANAVTFTPDGGVVEVSAGADRDDVVLRVRDTGVGVPADQAEAIFGLFARLPQTHPRAKGGLGVGLAVVRELVARHGGTVRCHSDGPGRGSEFVVRLPAAG
jgi:signal transduction histidine kinase